MDNEYMYAVGRMVQGDVFTPQTKNMTGGPLTDLKGNPKVQYFIGLAMAKTDPAFADIWAKLSAIAAAGFPGGETQRADFAWKVVDGDLPRHSQKVGFPGHWVFRFTSGFPVGAYTQGGAQQITDPLQIKRGYYIRIPFTAKTNGNATKPGLYLNMALVELIGYGEEISSGPDAQALLANGGAVAMPNGASATPVAGASPLTPGPGALPGGPGVSPGPGAPLPGGMPGATGLPGAVPGGTGALPGAPMPGGPVAGPGALPGAGVQMPGAVPPLPGAVVTPAPDFLAPPVMTAAAGGASYEAYKAQGWTDELLIQHGYMAPRG